MSKSIIQKDFLIIGSGIAGLSFALKIAHFFKDKKILVVTKSEGREGNTKYAQGGIAAVWDKTVDSFEQHIQDTMTAGDGLCDPKVVEMVIKEAPDRLHELINWGANFDKNEEGAYDLGREGGHSQDRVLHHKDSTGKEIIDTLLKKVAATKNIELLTNHFTIDLITEHQVKKLETRRNDELTCFGAYVLDSDSEKVKTIAAKVTLLATGGSGQVYTSTTNPEVATGDGLGIAYRAKAEISEVEFIQFHPTALYNPGAYPAFLITEAIRGEGAVLRDFQGNRFMHLYDERQELAPRDIVARAIDKELKKEGVPHVYLDCTQIDSQTLASHFPNTTERCAGLGIDIRKDFIPVLPAQHYICGGVTVNENAETSIQNLYASGEVACSGLHGANRLASNSLLEALVFSNKAFENIKNKFSTIKKLPDVPLWNDSGVEKNMEKVLISHDRAELKTIMSNYVGIVRSNERLLRAEQRLKNLYEDNRRLYDNSELSVDLCELRNMITTAYLITQFSKRRNENRGGFYNVDLS